MSKKQIVKSIGSSKPIRMWIDGKCFNLKQFKTQKLGRGPSSSEDVVKTDNDSNDAIEARYSIDTIISFTKDDNGRICTSFVLPYLYYKKLNNIDFFDIVTLSERTKTEISVPKYDKQEMVMVTGENENNIIQAISEIHSAVGQIRENNVALQFVAIPLLSEEIKSNFELFKKEVLKERMTGVEDSIFQSCLKLHLTVVVFVLLDQREKNKATEALEEYNETVLRPFMKKNGPLKMQVTGLDCMNDNYEKVHVLYAKANFLNESEAISLQGFTNDLSDFFYEKGLLKKHEENVKIHMTLMNSKYRKDVRSPSKKWRKRKCFDARKIMEKYKDFNFGQCDLDSIHICNVSSEGEDGFYESLACIKL